VSWGDALLRWVVKYRVDCRDKPVVSRVAPNYLRDALPAKAPERAESWASIMSGESQVCARAGGKRKGKIRKGFI